MVQLCSKLRAVKKGRTGKWLSNLKGEEKLMNGEDLFEERGKRRTGANAIANAKGITGLIEIQVF